jgi:hypothetical protein
MQPEIRLGGQLRESWKFPCSGVLIFLRALVPARNDGPFAVVAAGLINERSIQHPTHLPPQIREVKPVLSRSYPPLLWISVRGPDSC